MLYTFPCDISKKEGKIGRQFIKIFRQKVPSCSENIFREKIEEEGGENEGREYLPAEFMSCRYNNISVLQNTIFQGQNKNSERLLEPLYSAGLNEYTLYLYVFMLLSR